MALQGADHLTKRWRSFGKIELLNTLGICSHHGRFYGFSHAHLKWFKAAACCNSPGAYQPGRGGPYDCQSHVRHRPSPLVPAPPGWAESRTCRSRDCCSVFSPLVAQRRRARGASPRRRCRREEGRFPKRPGGGWETAEPLLVPRRGRAQAASSSPQVTHPRTDQTCRRPVLPAPALAAESSRCRVAGLPAARRALRRRRCTLALPRSVRADLLHFG